MMQSGVQMTLSRNYEKEKRNNETFKDHIEVIRNDGYLWVHYNQTTLRPPKSMGADEDHQTVMNPIEF